MFVLITFGGRRPGVPLAQWEAGKGGLRNARAVEDWHYWLARGMRSEAWHSAGSAIGAWETGRGYVAFVEPIRGPLALGFGCRFGLGLFRPASPN